MRNQLPSTREFQPQNDLNETFHTHNRRAWERLIYSSVAIYLIYSVGKVIVESPEFAVMVTEINKNIAVATMGLQNLP